MENNTMNNVAPSAPKKKGGLAITIIIIILIIIAGLVYMKMKNQNAVAPITQSEKDLNNAVTTDTTASINSNLDSIKVEDSSSADLQGVDSDLEKL